MARRRHLKHMTRRGEEFTDDGFVKASRSMVLAEQQDVVQRVGNAIIGGDFTGNARGDYAVDIQIKRADATCVASGANSIAYGSNSRAAGAQSIAIGKTALADGLASVALGATIAASADNAVGIGSNVTASAVRAVAVGRSAWANGTQAVALGSSAFAIGDYGVAVGATALAGSYDVAIGYFATAEFTGSIAIGKGATVEMTDSIAIGSSAVIPFGYTGSNNIVIGKDAAIQASISNAVGIGTQARPEMSGDVVLAGTQLRLQTSAAPYTYKIVWHDGNDGAGSGLDADLLDGLHASAFAASAHDMVSSHTYSGGAALDVFGLSAASTIAKLTPSADVSAGATALLRSSAGALALKALTISKGIAGPEYKLDVQGATTNLLFLKNTSTGATGTFQIGDDLNIIASGSLMVKGTSSLYLRSGGDHFLQNIDGSSTYVTVKASGNVGIWTTEPGTMVHAVLNNATTNAIDNILTLGHNSTGAPAAGFGGAMLFTLESSTTADQSAARIHALWNDATHASRKADLVLTAYDTAEREIMRGRGNGSAAAIGFLGADAAARQAHIADADGTLADITTKFNALLSYIETFGLIATS